MAQKWVKDLTTNLLNIEGYCHMRTFYNPTMAHINGNDKPWFGCIVVPMGDKMEMAHITAARSLTGLKSALTKFCKELQIVRMSAEMVDNHTTDFICWHNDRVIKEKGFSVY